MDGLRHLNSTKASADTDIRELFPFGLLADAPRDPRNDRAIVLVTTTVVEHGLEHAILEALALADAPGQNESRDTLFDGESAIVGDLSSKIRFALLLKIIGPTTAGDLHLIRAIRNAFAHGRQVLTFDTPEISACCNQLAASRQWEEMMVGHVNNDGREHFIQICFHLCLYLFSYSPGARKKTGYRQRRVDQMIS